MNRGKTIKIILVMMCCVYFAGSLSVNALAEEKLEPRVIVETVNDVPVIRGETLEKRDAIDPMGKTVSSLRPATEIIAIGDAPGAADYANKKDFIAYNNILIEWLPEGRHPKAGATYFITFKYVASEKGHNTMSSGIHITDGKMLGSWTDKAPSWIYVDLGKEQTVARVVIVQSAEEAPRYIARKMAIQFSLPGASDLKEEKSWENAVSLGEALKNPLEQVMAARIDMPIKPVKARYCRLLLLSGCSANGFGYIKELELYGP